MIGRPPKDEKDKASSQIFLRTKSNRKTAYVIAAQKKRQTLTAWAFENLDAAAEFKDY